MTPRSSLGRECYFASCRRRGRGLSHLLYITPVAADSGILPPSPILLSRLFGGVRVRKVYRVLSTELLIAFYTRSLFLMFLILNLILALVVSFQGYMPPNCLSHCALSTHPLCFDDNLPVDALFVHFRNPSKFTSRGLVAESYGESLLTRAFPSPLHIFRDSSKQPALFPSFCSCLSFLSESAAQPNKAKRWTLLFKMRANSSQAFCPDVFPR